MRRLGPSCSGKPWRSRRCRFRIARKGISARRWRKQHLATGLAVMPRSLTQRFGSRWLAFDRRLALEVPASPTVRWGRIMVTVLLTSLGTNSASGDMVAARYRDLKRGLDHELRHHRLTLLRQTGPEGIDESGERAGPVYDVIHVVPAVTEDDEDGASIGDKPAVSSLAEALAHVKKLGTCRCLIAEGCSSGGFSLEGTPTESAIAIPPSFDRPSLVSFAAGFYEAIATNNTLQTSYWLGCCAIDAFDRDEPGVASRLGLYSRLDPRTYVFSVPAPDRRIAKQKMLTEQAFFGKYLKLINGITSQVASQRFRRFCHLHEIVAVKPRHRTRDAELLRRPRRPVVRHLSRARGARTPTGILRERRRSGPRPSESLHMDASGRGRHLESRQVAKNPDRRPHANASTKNSAQAGSISSDWARGISPDSSSWKSFASPMKSANCSRSIWDRFISWTWEACTMISTTRR